jgi:hypothetical protein
MCLLKLRRIAEHGARPHRIALALVDVRVRVGAAVPSGTTRKRPPCNWRTFIAKQLIKVVDDKRRLASRAAQTQQTVANHAPMRRDLLVARQLAAPVSRCNCTNSASCR